jgi:hypothetical protein
MCQAMVRRLHNTSESYHVRKVARLLARPLRFDRGEEREGRRAHEKLMSSSPVDWLVALGIILYLVRCNLVHGSKAEMGDDELVIEASVAPLKLLLEKAVKLTERQLSSRGVS